MVASNLAGLARLDACVVEALSLADALRRFVEKDVQVDDVEVDVLEVVQVLHSKQEVEELGLVRRLLLLEGLSHLLDILQAVLGGEEDQLEVLPQLAQHLDQVAAVAQVQLECLLADHLHVGGAVISHHLVLSIDREKKSVL